MGNITEGIKGIQESHRVNRIYLKGRAKEYKTISLLKDLGYVIAQRSAGSHSPIDVWAINKEQKLITLVQCKGKKATDRQLDKIKKQYSWLKGKWRVEFRVI